MQSTHQTDMRPIQVLGTGFVEFTSPDPQALLATLKQVGFRQIARHRSKNAVLMQQGEIRFVANFEPESHSETFGREHGPSCSGMAFLVENAADSMLIALELDAKALERRPSSLLPSSALSGIGGSALYLADRSVLDELWAEFKFEEAGDGTPSDASLRRLDHLTHCVRPGAMAQWVDFYKRLFGFEEVFKFVAGDKSNGFETIAVRDPLNNACVTVLEPMGKRSQIQEFIDEYNGEGIQHLALLSDDLYETVTQMRANGVDFLPTPKAYYDAIGERLPNHGEDVQRMQELGMLVDGAATGENPDNASRLLLQIFTRKMVGPIFFEAIERKGNRGFGEGNAKALFEAIKREQDAAGNAGVSAGKGVA